MSEINTKILKNQLLQLLTELEATTTYANQRVFVVDLTAGANQQLKQALLSALLPLTVGTADDDSLYWNDTTGKFTPKTTDEAKTILGTNTVNAIGAGGGGTLDIDFSLGKFYSVTIDTATTTFTLSNPPTTALYEELVMEITNGGSQTVNFPASFDFVGGMFSFGILLRLGVIKVFSGSSEGDGPVVSRRRCWCGRGLP